MTGSMTLARRARDAAVEAAVAGAVVGVVEAMQVVGAAGAGSRLIVAGVAALGAIAGALVVRAVLTAIGQVTVLGGWARAVRAGELRAIVRGAIVGIAIVALGAFVFAVAVRRSEER